MNPSAIRSGKREKCIIIASAIGITLAGAVAGASRQNREDILIADFEGTTYGDWKATGAAFGTGPARGTLPGQMEVRGFEAKGLVTSFHGGDASTGTLSSP